jgi:Xaa-Pro dipeptidase
MTTFLPALTSALDIPETPDIERMRFETGARLRSAMSDRGVDALILLGNNAVVYAAGVSWPLGDAGLSYVERPVAVVLADDAHPHLFLPSVKARRRNPVCPPAICTDRCIWNSTRA